MSRKSIALLLLLGLLWGSNFLFMKLATTRISAVDVSWLRTLFGGLPILALALVGNGVRRGDWRSIHHFAAMALLANVGPYLFFVLGTQFLPSGVAGVISGAIPCITAVIVAIALPEEKLTGGKLVGLALGFAGVVLVTPHDDLSLSGSSLPGVAAMLAGSVSYALALVYARRFVQPLGMGPVKLAAYQMVLTCLCLAPFANPSSLWALAEDRTVLLSLVFGLGLVGTGLAFVIYYYLVGSVGALRAASVSYISPAVALALGATFLGERVSALQVGGGALIMAGIFYANRQVAEPES